MNIRAGNNDIIWNLSSKTQEAVNYFPDSILKLPEKVSIVANDTKITEQDIKTMFSRIDVSSVKNVVAEISNEIQANKVSSANTEKSKLPWLLFLVPVALYFWKKRGY